MTGNLTIGSHKLVGSSVLLKDVGGGWFWIRNSADSLFNHLRCAQFIVDFIDVRGNIDSYIPTADLSFRTYQNVASGWKLQSWNGAYVDHLKWKNGKIYLFNLPVADPHVVGQLWNNGGVVTVSAG